MMFARKLYMYLKNDGALAFKQKIEEEVIPLLLQQKGFLAQISFLYLNGREVQTFSVWKTAEDAEVYSHETYPRVLRMLAAVIDGAPKVESFDVLSSTLQNTCALVSGARLP
jgi:hypothetical protein